MADRSPSIAMRHAAIVAIACALAVGCVKGTALDSEFSAFATEANRLHDPALRCEAEREIAMAEAHLTFARYELQRGNRLRAQWHADIVGESLDAANEIVDDRPYCFGVVDRDGDGIEDPVDSCPESPEDFDGYEDDDGCPEDQDTDRDRIPDSVDECPRQPEDYDGFEDEDGCPEDQDTDGDGILDSEDRCPLEPEDIDGHEDEDGCPDIDDDIDGDGYLNDEDGCPESPEDFDGFEDEDGCPDDDNDGDGILDVDDQCPMEPEDFDGDRDDDGCPEEARLIQVTEDRIELDDIINFELDSDVIVGETSFRILDDIADVLRERESMELRIEGHTDSTGSERYNLRLSQERADAVRVYLIQQGIEPSRIEAVGFGEERPIADNDTEEGRAENRRVEFHITRR